MPHDQKYLQDRGIYGRKEWPAQRPSPTHPFAVFKDETGWQIGHIKTGLSVCSLIPRGVGRTKTALLLLLAQMEADEPDAVAAMNDVEGSPIKGDALRTAGQKLIDWRRAREGGVMAGNPFRTNRELARMFDACVSTARDNFSEFYVVPRRPGWYGPNVPRRSASHRHAFWNGWNDAPIRWDSYSRQSLSYAAYRAGQALRKERERRRP